jgi:serine/threonine protein phosphatase 1
MSLEHFLDLDAIKTVEALRHICAATSANGTRTYAIGDVHGCANLLVALLEAVHMTHPVECACRLVFLGDLVDRGPEIAKTVALVQALQQATEAVQCLRGNHEQMMIDWLRDDDDLWLANGGVDTVESFARSGGNPDEFLTEAVEWMEGLPTWREDGARLFVHAGLRPGLPYNLQSDDDRLWIREGFLDVDYNFGKHVIHGHTPQLGGPERRRFRTNIDTGAVYGGALTAAVLDDENAAPIAFLQVPAA